MANWRNIARRAASRAWEARYCVPLTPLSAALVATSLWIYRSYATERMDFVLYAAALVALAVVGIAVAMVMLVAAVLLWRLRRQRGIVDLELTSGVRAATGYSFPRFVAWPLVQVSLQWSSPARVEVSVERVGGRVQEVVEPAERGDHVEVRRRFVVADIFGLARLGFWRRARQRARILPGSAKVSGQVLAHIAGGESLSHPAGPVGGELLDMRRYAPGDPLRLVLWKAFGRSRQLLVRTPERAISPSPSAIAYFVAGRDDEATAGTARAFLELGLLGADFLFSADGADEPTADPAEAVEQIVRSVFHRDRGAIGLHELLARGVRDGRHSCVLFLPPTPGPWLARVEREVALPQGTTAVIAVDRPLATGGGRRWLRRLLFAGPPVEGGRAPRALIEVVRRLERRGLRVKLLHRPSGTSVAPSQLVGERRAAVDRGARS